MKIIKSFNKWKKLLESKDLIEFPLKKYTSIVRDKILNNIEEGNNQIRFKFSDNELSDQIDIIININWIKNSNNKINGNTDIYKAFGNEFKEFEIQIDIETIDINYNEVLSVIQHELKHIYDILSDSYEENTFLKVKPISILKREFTNIPNFYYFIHLVYESLRHELEARNTSIYDRFRWLKIYDNDLIAKEFEKTYINKSLKNLREFDSEYFISLFDTKELIKLTNRFIEIYGDFDKIVNDENLKNFYKYWEDYFKKSSNEYLEKSKGVIDEIIKDIKPYSENKLTTEHLEFNKYDKFKDMFINKLNKYKLDGKM